jgi:DNA-binding MarR family transcriptional regulator
VTKISREECIDQIELYLRTFIRQFRNEINNLLGEEMTPNEFYILKLLMHTSPKIVTSISNEMGVSPSHITSVGDRLVQKGLIIRNRSAHDRRVVELSITEKGKKLMKLREKKKLDYMSTKFVELSDDELRQLAVLLEKVSI